MTFRGPPAGESIETNEADVRLTNLLWRVGKALVTRVRPEQTAERPIPQEHADQKYEPRRDLARLHPHVPLHELAIDQFVPDGVRQLQQVVGRYGRKRRKGTHRRHLVAQVYQAASGD